MYKKIFLLVLLFNFFLGFSQPISLYRQFFGSYDFTMIGNTLNTAENSIDPNCMILTQSSANLNMNISQTVTAAYLYWSSNGSLSQADLDIELNGVPVSAQRTFFDIGNFGAFADVTNLVQTTGNGNYLFSDFGNSINCGGTGYAGWAIIIVYEDSTLSGQMVNIYDGFQYLSPGSISNPNNIKITLSDLNLTDNANSKVGFLAWEGDDSIAAAEELRINGNVVSNLPLNPADNIFNGTNSFTGSNVLYNMDLDFFAIDNYIIVGDKSLDIQIDSGGDIISLNALAVTLINLMPDATITIDDINVPCDSRNIKVSYTVSNINASLDLIANVPIAFYADGILVGTTQTKSNIAIKGSLTGSITLNIPQSVDNDFVIIAKVDDDGTNNGVVDEVEENNNIDNKNASLKFSSAVNNPADIIVCDEGKGFVLVNLSDKYSEISNDNNVTITFHETKEDAEKGTSKITTVTNYEIKSYTSKIIWVRVKDNDNGCAAITFFTITAQMLPFSELKEPLILCNLKNDPSAVNLSYVHLLLSKMFPYMNEIDLKFYENENDAYNDVREIMNVTNYKPNIFPKLVWIRTKGKNNFWCDNIIQLQLNDCVVPKGISPNEDGLNDGFNLEIFNLVELKIFNRYGMEVYKHGEGYIDQWKGQDKNNRELPSGTYFYTFKTLFDTYVGYVYVIKEVQ